MDTQRQTSPRSPNLLRHRAWKLLGASLLSVALLLNARSEGLHKTSSASYSPLAVVKLDTKGPFARSPTNTSDVAASPLQECLPRVAGPMCLASCVATAARP